MSEVDTSAFWLYDVILTRRVYYVRLRLAIHLLSTVPYSNMLYHFTHHADGKVPMLVVISIIRDWY